MSFIVINRANLSHPMLFRLILQELLHYTNSLETIEISLKLVQYLLIKSSNECMEEHIIFMCCKLMSIIEAGCTNKIVMRTIETAVMLFPASNAPANVHIAFTALDRKISSLQPLFETYSVLKINTSHIFSLLEICAVRGFINETPLIYLESVLQMPYDDVSNLWAAYGNVKKLQNCCLNYPKTSQVLSRLVVKFDILLGQHAKSLASRESPPVDGAISPGYILAMDYIAEAVFSNDMKIADAAVEACGRILMMPEEISDHLSHMQILKVKGTNLRCRPIPAGEFRQRLCLMTQALGMPTVDPSLFGCVNLPALC
jgi:hypothetical protein